MIVKYQPEVEIPTQATEATGSELPYGSLSTSFQINLGKDVDGNALSADGYGTIHEDGVTYEATDVYKWLNNTMINKIETSLASILQPVRKVSRPLYLVEDSEGSGTYHKYGGNDNIGYYKHYRFEFPDCVDDNGSALTFEDKYGIYSYGNKLWLPTAYELGAPQHNLSTADPYEYSAYTNAITSQNEDVIKYNSLRIDGKCPNSWGSIWIDRCNVDIYDIPEFTYDYFKLSDSECAVSGYWCICRNYYAVLNTDVTDTTITWDSEDITNLYNKYKTAERCSCLVIARNINHTYYGYRVYDRDAGIPAYMNLYTDFCFVTF